MAETSVEAVEAEVDAEAAVEPDAAPTETSDASAEASDATDAPASPDAPATPDAPTTPRVSPLRKHLRAIATTLAVYQSLHIVAFLGLLRVLHARDEPLKKFLHLGWDSAFYLDIARRGYEKSPDYAFFPLYSQLVHVLHVFGLTFNYTGVLTTILATSAAAVGIRYVGEKVAGARVGLILTALWAVVPSAVIQVWAYADGLYTAFAAWTLYALLRRAWLTAGVLTLLAGLTRPSASALILTVGLFALIAIIRREDGWRPWVGAALAPLGMLGYIFYVGHHFGKTTAYFKMQRDTWNNWFDGGKTTLDNFAALVDGRADHPDLVFVIVILTMFAVPFLLVLAYRQRLPWPLLVYSTALAVLVLCSHRQTNIVPRELMSAFPLLLPLAQQLSRARNRGLIVGMLVIAAASGWYAWFLPLTYGAP